MLRHYLDAISLTERLHRQFLDVLKAELEARQIRDINNVQALILFNIGGDEVTVGELTLRGYYLGSNVSYNLKKMIEAGYLAHSRSPHDKRTVRIALSPKGRALWVELDAILGGHASLLEASDAVPGLAAANATLRGLERFWGQAARAAMHAIDQRLESEPAEPAEAPASGEEATPFPIPARQVRWAAAE